MTSNGDLGNVFASVKEVTLKNGLTVYLVHDPTAAIVSARTYVQAGSTTEYDYFGTGVSHYLEHVVAGGTTEKRSEKDYTKLISNFGGAFNAYTSPDHTSYFINTTPEHVNDTLSVLYEWMFLCRFEAKEVTREKGVIIKEIEKNDANIRRKFYQKSQENFYKYNPLQYPVIGYKSKFKGLSRENLIAYYKDYYVPSNMVLVVGGNLDMNNVMAHIKTTFGSIPYGKAPLVEPVLEPTPVLPRISETEGKTNVTYWSIRFPTVALNHPDLYPLDLMEYMLTNGEESILYKALVEDKKLAYSVHSASYTPPLTTGYYEIQVTMDKQNKDAVMREIQSIIAALKKGRFDQKRIDRAKKQKLTTDIFSIDTIEDKVMRAGESYLVSYTSDFFERYVDNFKNVEKDDIVRAAREYLQFDRYSLTVLDPETQEEAVEKRDLRSVDVMVPEKVTLENGVTVLMYQDTALPKTLAKIFVLGGIRAETTENNGIGHITASLLGSGSERYTKSSIKQKIEDHGASMGGNLGRNTLYYSLETLSEDFDTLFPLFTHTFLKPRFVEKELKEVKRRTLQAIKQRPDDWQRYSAYLFKQMFYKDHPYGLSQLGEVESIEKLTVSDIKDHFEQLLHPTQLVVTVFGDFDRDHVLNMIQKSFSNLGGVEDTYVLAESIQREMHQKAIDKTVTIDQNVAAVYIAFDGVDYSNKEDLLKLDLVDSVLSGMSYPGGRLHPLLRGQELVYMVHAYQVPGMETGHFMVVALTDVQNVEKVKGLILGEIESLKTKVISEEEFQKGMSQVSFHDKDRYSSLENLSLITATDELYGMGYDHFLKADERHSTLTPQDVLTTASKYLVNPQIYVFKGQEETSIR
ncbi:MAG: insulinase family protein [Candidatus Margulisbacteria bacterium]|nr:insulinase family protein [Candidatus Margulisiibacteriota bacterium]